MAGELRVKDCYVGQRVYWVMWCDPGDTPENRTGYYFYKPHLSPEIWSAAIERLHKNGSVVLCHYGRAFNVYPCEVDAVRGEYERFCAVYLPSGGPLSSYAPSNCALGEASRVLRELAELEFGVNAWASSAMSSTQWQMECRNGR